VQSKHYTQLRPLAFSSLDPGPRYALHPNHYQSVASFWSLAIFRCGKLIIFIAIRKNENRRTQPPDLAIAGCLSTSIKSLHLRRQQVESDGKDCVSQ
jgi:hypothetical protein